ncbi:helix-turn-helix transcriptional regulator [Alkaliphilus pronyensis]|uniref:Helix-turn-helix transcriptional regulator n=1 Tax=Alkaliphilus pronyensis TaxID=1482732 RepID=A0A6I0F7R4_9FIRM|nr:helix-turn-helix transcriptional regulator [Alkaliphilus pronyensis]KAB3534425.1 helix-turn-helix transcriptional regulator [Alkaliphilus pronyensis]
MNFEEYKKRAFEKDPELYEEYKALEPEYEIIKQIIKARGDLNLTQKELAERIGVKQSNISRLESGDYNPSLDFLKKVAKGLGKELHIEFR